MAVCDLIGVLYSLLLLPSGQQISRNRKFFMWLPTPVYESLPCAYVVGGLLFVSGAIYLGPSDEAAPLYLTLGLISILSGVFIHIKRKQSRQKKANARPQAEPE